MKRILVIDDDPSFLDFAGLQFGKAGFMVITAMDGKNGMHILRTLGADLIFLDISTDLEFFYALETMLPRPPVVLMTEGKRGVTASTAHEIGLKVGAMATLRKPFDAGVLGKLTSQLFLKAA